MGGEGAIGSAIRYGHAVAQTVLRLFAAGAVLYEAHNLFLRYYANEWAGIQFSGVNGCAGEDMIANGDLIGGQTFCNKPENFVPWIEIYHRHALAATLYYGAIVVVLVLIGLVWGLIQNNRASTTPFGAAPTAPDLSNNEHLR